MQCQHDAERGYRRRSGPFDEEEPATFEREARESCESGIPATVALDNKVQPLSTRPCGRAGAAGSSLTAILTAWRSGWTSGRGAAPSRRAMPWRTFCLAARYAWPSRPSALPSKRARGARPATRGLTPLSTPSCTLWTPTRQGRGCNDGNFRRRRRRLCEGIWGRADGQRDHKTGENPSSGPGVQRAGGWFWGQSGKNHQIVTAERRLALFWKLLERSSKSDRLLTWAYGIHQ